MAVARRRRRSVAFLCLVMGVQIAVAQKPAPAPSGASRATGRLLADDVRSRLVEAANPQSDGTIDETADVRGLLQPLELEFRRSPSLFTLLDYGLILEADRPRPPRDFGEPPAVWTNETFTAMRRLLERYTVGQPVPRDAVPRSDWWPQFNISVPVVPGNSKRPAASLRLPGVSLFKADIDVFAFSGVPELERQRERLRPATPGFLYTSPFAPQVAFPSTAPLLANLAPLVEMFKVEGAGTLAMAFAGPKEVQVVLEEWSKVVDTGSGTLTVAEGDSPVYAVTHAGLVKGSLVKVESHSTPCGRDGEYQALFRFERPLPKSTYAIIRTTSRLNIARARITTVRELTWFARPSYEWGFWYADLDGDGRQDLAVTVGGERRYSGDYFTSAIYANVNGRWKQLVFSRVESCT